MAEVRGRFHEDRIVAILLAAGTAWYWTGVEALKTLKSDDVVGPAGFPALLAIVTFILCVALWFHPNRERAWSSIRGNAWLFLAVFAVYIVLMPAVGFPISTVLFLVTMFTMLGVDWRYAIVVAGLSAAVCFVVFSMVLDEQLPLVPWLG